MIKRFSSPAALRAAFINSASAQTRSHGRDKDKWYGNETLADTLQLALEGNTALVPAAERLMSQIESQIETPRRQWSRAPAGAFCCVPDVLAGLPTPMRRQTYERDETTPITILAVTTSSGGIPARVLAQRGTTILALVMALARIRPVSLHAVAILDGRDNGETILTTEINTHPLDLATACYVLTSAGYDRRLTHGLARSLNHFTGGWPANYKYRSNQPYMEYLAQALSPVPRQTLVIPPAELHDRLLAEPVEWINTQIKRFTQTEEELAS